MRCIARPPDIVVMDIRMPRMDGIEATRRILREHPEVKVLALTTFTTREYVAPMLAAGASGYLVKDRADELVPAIRAVLSNDFYISPEISNVLVHLVLRGEEDEHSAHPSAGRSAAWYPSLTPREDEALQWLARGHSNQEIAQSMYVSLGSVKAYLARAGDKLGTRDRVQLLIRATQLGIVQPRIDEQN